MTDFLTFSNFLRDADSETILSDRSFALAMDTGDDYQEQEARFEMIRYEAVENHGISQEAYDLWVDETVLKYVDSGQEFIEDAILSGEFADFLDILDKFHGEQLPIFPIDALPPVLRECAANVAENLQVPVDMPAVVALAVCAMSVQRKFAIQPKPGWVEPLNLYCAVVAAPSERKSPVLKEMSKPIHQHTKDENKKRQTAISAYERTKKILTTKVENLTKQAASGKIEVEEVLAAQQELDELEPVRPLRLLADDTTPEALTKLLSQNNGVMCVMSAEGGIFSILAGLYTSSHVNIDTFLKAYSGDFIQVDRLGRESETIENPALTMLLMIQPQVLQEIMKNDEFAGRGLLARFLYALPASALGSRSYDIRPIPAEPMENYNRLVKQLLAISCEEKPKLIYLSDGAEKLARDYFYELEPRLVDDLEDMGEWAGKLHGQTMRIAGILHCCVTQEDAGAELLSASTMSSAIAISKYFEAHAKVAFRMMGVFETEKVKNARYVWRRILTTEGNGMTKSDLVKLCKGRLNAEAMQPALDVLESHGYIRVDTIRTGKAGKPKTIIKISPKAKRLSLH